MDRAVKGGCTISEIKQQRMVADNWAICFLSMHIADSKQTYFPLPKPLPARKRPTCYVNPAYYLCFDSILLNF